MVNIALGIILALVILVVLFVVGAFLAGIYQAARDEVNDEGFGQKVLDGIICLVKSPVTYFKYAAPILTLCIAIWAAGLVSETASLIIYLVGLMLVVFYFAYLREQKKARERANNEG
jgi:preprotein translocase subunit YajC